MTLVTCVIALAIGFVATAIGCGGPRVVLVPTTTGVVRLGPDVKGHVYVMTGGVWVLSRNRVKLPEGWYVTDLNDESDPLPNPNPTD
jgi:hypothetical protein